MKKEACNTGEFYLENALALLGLRTLKQLADVLEVDEKTIYRVRRGAASFPLTHFCKLLIATDKKPSEMFLELGMPADYFYR